jgi:hypothetical protein
MIPVSSGPILPWETSEEILARHVGALHGLSEEALLLALLYAIAGPSEDPRAAAIRDYVEAHGWKHTLQMLAELL